MAPRNLKIGTSAVIKLSPPPRKRGQGLNWRWQGLTLELAGAAGRHSTESTQYSESKISMSETFLKITSSSHSFQQLRLPAERWNTCLSQNISLLVIDMSPTAVGLWGAGGVGRMRALTHQQKKYESLQSSLESNLAISFKIRNTHTL